MSLALSLKDRIILFIVAVLTVGILGFVVYTQQQNAAQLKAIQTQVIATQQLADNINRAQSTWATKADLTTFAQQNDINLGVIQSNLNTLNASLSAINQATANSSGEQANNVPSSGSAPGPTSEPTSTASCNGQPVTCTNPDKYNYLSTVKTENLTENFPALSGGTPTVVPVGSVSFTASQSAPWTINLAPRAYNLDTILGTKNDGSGQQVAYNTLTINTGGKDYTVPISKNNFLQQVPTAKFSWWNPRLYLGADTGLNVSKLPLTADFIPALNLGIMSYGTTTTQPDWSVLEVGVGYGVASKTPQVSVMPFSYNLGSNLKPTVQNLYLGPTLDLGTNGNIVLGAGIRVGL